MIFLKMHFIDNFNNYFQSLAVYAEYHIITNNYYAYWMHDETSQFTIDTRII